MLNSGSIKTKGLTENNFCLKGKSPRCINTFKRNFLEKITLSSDIVNVFTIDMSALETYSSKLVGFLSHEEKSQANKFLFKHLKNRYIVSHGLLRILLSQYLSFSPSQIEYTFNEFQKPLCKHNPNIYFNMSHSNKYVSYAFSLNHQVGIDIEFMDDNIEIEDLLPAITAANESFTLEKLDKNDKFYLFYKTWTIKEAFLKALGFGLHYSLSNIETSVLPKEKFKVIKCNEISEKEIDNMWTFSDINSPPGYLGAVAVKKKAAKINIVTIDSLLFIYILNILHDFTYK